MRRTMGHSGTHTHKTRLMLGSVCATLPDTAAYEHVITLILWVLLPGYGSGGQSAAPLDVTVGFRVFRNVPSVPVTGRCVCVVGLFEEMH